MEKITRIEVKRTSLSPKSCDANQLRAGSLRLYECHMLNPARIKRAGRVAVGDLALPDLDRAVKRARGDDAAELGVRLSDTRHRGIARLREVRQFYDQTRVSVCGLTFQLS